MSEIDISKEISKIILNIRLSVRHDKDSYHNGWKDACDNILSDILKYLTDREHENKNN